uniref:FixH family protein n=1 Tax=Flavobacterium sp. TaxID=239 RepID=UPI0040496B8A
MKINWGTGIFIAIVCFMGFILYFVLKVQSDSSYDHELVADDYYKQELDFQNQLNKSQNTTDSGYQVSITKTTEGIQIEFPAGLNKESIEGKVSFYRPSNQRLDFEYQISKSNPDLLIPTKSLVGGRWDISVDWQYQGKNYLSKQTVYF